MSTRRSTNRKRAARDLANKTGLTYQQALAQVIANETTDTITEHMSAQLFCPACGLDDVRYEPYFDGDPKPYECGDCGLLFSMKSADSLPSILGDEWAGAFVDGYTDDDTRSLFSEIQSVTGIVLTCVWDYYDEAGFGGDSVWYITEWDHEGRPSFFELEGDLWAFVSNPKDHPDAAAVRDPWTWKGVKVTFPQTPQEWNGYNWPFEDRR